MVNERSLKDIELDLVLDKVRSYSLFNESEEYINFNNYTDDENVLNSRYLKIDKYMNLLEGSAELDSFADIRHIFDFVKKSHQDIDSSDVFLVGEFLSSYQKMLSFLEEDDLDEDTIKLKDDILFSLDREGNVNENHPRLLIHKRALDAAKAKRSSYTASFMRENQSLIAGDNPLFRDQRIVLPIRASEKGKVHGYLQGSSSSGQTLYMESLDLINYNNEVVLAEERIKEEERKIKHELSCKVRDIIEPLKEMREKAIDFDFHYSYAIWAKKNDAKHIRHSDKIKLINARHPLLKKAVPITISINEDIKSVVFSGANAGGKTVTMKTIALLSALNQICTFIPADEESSMPYFDTILTDIGDNQSILSDESTFSAHLKNISFVIKNTSPKSLILLDELGSGTDPDEGSALALSILSYLITRSRLTLSSSHYSKVKNHAYITDSMMNASMAFSDSTGLPLYKVIENIPGDSHALDAAKRAHLPKEITDNARLILSDKNESAASLISSLIKKSRTLDKKISEAEDKRHKAERANERLEKKIEELEKEKRGLEKEGLKEISSFLSKSRKTLEGLIKDITTGTLDKSKIKNAKAFMAEVEKKEESVRKSVKEKEESIEEVKEFAISEKVLCGKSRIKGTIISRSKNTYTVLLDSGLKISLKSSDIESYEAKAEIIIPAFSKSGKKAEYEMDLRGLSAREAEERLDDQMEAAILQNLKSFSIIHGLGDGILMHKVHEYLKSRKEVDSYYFARPEDGGMGKTYVTLN